LLFLAVEVLGVIEVLIYDVASFVGAGLRADNNVIVVVDVIAIVPLVYFVKYSMPKKQKKLN
jgi:hypothetical protein